MKKTEIRRVHFVSTDSKFAISFLTMFLDSVVMMYFEANKTLMENSRINFKFKISELKGSIVD